MSDGVLNRVRRSLAGWQVLRSLLILLGTIGLLALTLLLIDAALDLPASLRLATPWILAGSGLLVVVLCVIHGTRMNEIKLARRFEHQNPDLGNRLTNAVQLASQTGSADASGVGEYLRLEAIELGRRSASGIRAWPLVRRGMLATGALMGVAALAWAVTLWFGRDMTQAVFPRFFDPGGDHPPYSILRIGVQPRGGEVLFGGQFEIRASVRGRPVDRLWLLSRTATNESRALMFLAPDKSFFQTLANLREPTEYFITDGRARSHRFPIRIRYTPQITRVELTFHYPEYTGKTPRTAPLAEEPVALPEDTRVSFRVASNRPLRSGALALTPVLGGRSIEVPLQPEPDQPSLVTGSFTLASPVAFSLSVHDVDGLPCAEPRRGRLNISPDERPRLVVLEPGRNAVATPSIRIPIKVEAQDDFGITRVIWLRGHNRSIERPLAMPITLKDGARSIESAGALELGQLGVRPGDVIDYYFEAADNYPKGPNLALSRVYRLEIISEEKYQEILRQTAARKALFEPYFKMGGWLSRLAEEARDLEGKARDGHPGAAEAAQSLAAQLDKYSEELNQLMRHPLMFDVEQSFRNTLVTQHTRLGSARAKLKKAAGGGAGQPNASELKEIAEELSRLSETEQAQIGQPAQQIASVVPVLVRADSFVRLAQQQAALAQMLRRFGERTEALSRLEQIEVQELARAQARIRDALKTLVTQLPELLAQVPPEPAYEPLRQDVQRFLEAVTEAKIEIALADAAKTLAEPDTVAGYILAQQAAVKMDKLVAKCSGLPQQGQLCLSARFRPTLAQPGMGDTLQQILAAMNAGQGQGQGGQDGYGLFNEDVALYGPNVELAGEQAGGRREGDRGSGNARQTARLTGSPRDPALPPPEGPGRVHLQPDAKFPLRYRELVGDYFRSIAETESDTRGQP